MKLSSKSRADGLGEFSRSTWQPGGGKVRKHCCWRRCKGIVPQVNDDTFFAAIRTGIIPRFRARGFDSL
ncbi:hypothetical protein HNY73_003873 [Argiope bruennichi]|uniref:Uncharacterized protein n=1 Tax=Argiope bruennichi TaxID=94029 RepID=A0A8T0FU41_ARGBR|nr:hypothetical protein HNY73_003873 [Argiope bruennichi]